MVMNWEFMEILWAAVLEQLEAEGDEHPVLLAEDPLTPRINREKAAEVFLEKFNVPAYYVASQVVPTISASAGRM